MPSLFSNPNPFRHRDSQELSKLFQDVSPDTTLMQPDRKKDI